MQTAMKVQNNGHAWLNWSIAVAFVILVFGFQTGYAITNAQMAKSLKLSPADIGTIGSTYTFCFAITQLVSGALLDRLGAQRLLPAACAILTLGVFCFAFSGSLSLLIVAQVLIAIGAAFGFVGAGFVGGKWFAPERYGFMFSLVQFAASFSAFLSQQLLNQILVKLPWNWVITGIGVFGTFVLLLMFLWLRDPISTLRQEKQKTSSMIFISHVLHDVVSIFKIPQMWRVILVGAVSFGVMLCIGTVWGPLLLQSHGITESQANSAVSLSWLGLAFGAPAFVYWAEKYNKDYKALSVGLILQFISISCLLFIRISNALICDLLMFFWGFAAGASMLPFSIAAKKAGAAFAGTSAALVNGGQFLLAGFLITMAGHLMVSSLMFDIQKALIILPVSLLIAFILSLKN